MKGAAAYLAVPGRLKPLEGAGTGVGALPGANIVVVWPAPAPAPASAAAAGEVALKGR